jgi:hypothetical protein
MKMRRTGTPGKARRRRQFLPGARGNRFRSVAASARHHGRAAARTADFNATFAGPQHKAAGTLGLGYFQALLLCRSRRFV